MSQENPDVRSPEPASNESTTTAADATKLPATNPEDNGSANGNANNANPNPKKRTASESDHNGAPKITKRRAARACVSCRARKVRCDVVEGAPCGNCRWDNVECVVQESRRRK